MASGVFSHGDAEGAEKSVISRDATKPRRKIVWTIQLSKRLPSEVKVKACPRVKTSSKPCFGVNPGGECRARKIPL